MYSTATRTWSMRTQESAQLFALHARLLTDPDTPVSFLFCFVLFCFSPLSGPTTQRDKRGPSWRGGASPVLLPPSDTPSLGCGLLSRARAPAKSPHRAIPIRWYSWALRLPPDQDLTRRVACNLGRPVSC